jgi:hypothetical protein
MTRDMKSECYTCAHKREVPGDCHIRCANPDPAMVGVAHGIKRGWFIYPLLFDPVWKARLCQHYSKAVVSGLPLDDDDGYDETKADEERAERRAWKESKHDD